MNDEDERQTRRAIAGDREALGRIWERERSWLAMIVWSRCLDRDLTADLVQEAALILLDRIGDLREPRALRSWLKRSLLNRLNDELRRRLARAETRQEADPALLPAREIEPAAEDGPWMEALETLPVDLREPLVLRAMEGLGIARIAEILETSITTIETRLVRARRLLRERVERRRAAEEAGRPSRGETR